MKVIVLAALCLMAVVVATSAEESSSSNWMNQMNPEKVQECMKNCGMDTSSFPSFPGGAGMPQLPAGFPAIPGYPAAKP